MEEQTNNKKILTAISCASLIVILLVWWLYCDVFKLVPNAVFPGPDKVINTFITKLYSKKPEGATIFDHAFASLKVCLLGYVLGAIVGIPLGIMMAWNKWVDRFARPLFDLIRPVPGLAWIPLFILLFGIGVASKAMIIFLSVGMIEQLADTLKEEYREDTPVAVVYKASWEDQKIVIGNLTNIAQKVKEAGITKTALTVVGDFLGDEYELSKLYDKTFTTEFRKGVTE